MSRAVPRVGSMRLLAINPLGFSDKIAVSRATDDQVHRPRVFQLTSKGAKFVKVVSDISSRCSLLHFDHEQVVIIISAAVNDDVRKDSKGYLDLNFSGLRRQETWGLTTFMP
jgi:hypothetical protein